MVKLTSFLISLLCVVFIANVYTLAIQDVATDANLNDIDPAALNAFNKTTALNDYLGTLNSSASETSISTGVVDVLEGTIMAGYSILLTSRDSIVIFSGMASSAVQNTPIGYVSQPLLTLIVSVVFVLIIVGVIISSLVKREL